MTTFEHIQTVSECRGSTSSRTSFTETHPHDREGARRALNVAVAAIGLVAAAPAIALIAFAIKVSSPGPVFYRQLRVGLDRRTENGGNHRRRVDIGGKPFTLYKFRTMRPSQLGDAQVWCGEDDPRITGIGRFLRRTRLDELPQLVNVLMGHMNVVGPRPEQPEIFQTLRTEVVGYQRRQQVRPGITGHAQINLAYDTCLDDVRKKVEHDLEYIAKHSVATDLMIMVRTPQVMVLRKGSR